MKEQNGIAICSSCRGRYRVSLKLSGRTITCKKCSYSFKIDFQDVNELRETQMAPPIENEDIEDISQDDVYLVIGKLAVKYKFVSVEQVNKALWIKKQAGKKVLLGDVMVTHGMMSQKQLDFLYSVQKMLETRRLDSRFAVIAVKNQFAAPNDIQRAVSEQKRLFKETKTVKLIGDILVEFEVINKEQRDAILLKQSRLEKTKDDENGKVQISDAMKRTEDDTEFELSVTEDKLKVFISPKREVPDSITVQDIKSLLEINGITYGIAGDIQIAEYLKSKSSHKTPWKIAEGQPPEHGEDTIIKYYFETDSLKAGKIQDDGAIDFKDRGEIPQVKKGDLLAEKISAKEGKPGKDVYGQPIPFTGYKNKKLSYGQGVEISEDRLKIFAENDGLPSISAFGKIYVLPKLEISGDVGHGTGHVDFDGKILVTGTIRNGFCVKGGGLSAKEILKAEIETTGDIDVSGGIIGTSIKTEGSIRAKFIHEADIEALGSVVVEKEIIDSNIETSGECIISKGTILSSIITAKKGIRALQIGSEMSKPCKLTVGVDQRIKNELDKINGIIHINKKEKSEFNNRLKELEDLPIRIENEIGKMAQIQDKAIVRKRNLQKEMEVLKKGSDPSYLADAETEINELDSEIKKVEEKLENLFDNQDQITEEIANVQQKLKKSEKEVHEQENRISEITEWSENDRGVPKVSVKDTIFQDTAIDGIYSSTTLKKNCQNVLIKEDKNQDPDDRAEWKIKVLQRK